MDTYNGETKGDVEESDRNKEALQMNLCNQTKTALRSGSKTKLDKQYIYIILYYRYPNR